jgi:hypothetical protein
MGEGRPGGTGLVEGVDRTVSVDKHSICDEAASMARSRRIGLARSGFDLIIPASFRREVVGDGFHVEGRLGINDHGQAVGAF